MNKKIVCLGGGIGTVNLVKGLKEYTKDITVVVSMADDGGSAGRVRRFFGVPPPGDLVSCISALSQADPILTSLLTYRFSGNRYGSDGSIPGHKLGNLMLVALTSITGSFNKAVYEMQRIFNTAGVILPSTDENISIWAKTSVGEKVYREENIDLGKFTGRIDKLYLKPANPTIPIEVKKAILGCDAIIAGPGDLFTTILPVLLVPDILKVIKESRAKKFFIINVTNKVFETPDFKISDYVDTIVKHCGSRIFDYFFVNNNYKAEIPRKFKYQYGYVCHDTVPANAKYKVVKEDFIDENFPLYHNSHKLANVLLKHI